MLSNLPTIRTMELDKETRTSISLSFTTHVEWISRPLSRELKTAGLWLLVQRVYQAIILGPSDMIAIVFCDELPSEYAHGRVEHRKY